MEAVKRIGTLFLLVIFLFGITGLSVFHHTCGSSHKDKVTLYAEIFKAAPGSCCEGEALKYASGCLEDMTRKFDATPCCKSTNTFLSLHIVTERHDKLVIKGFASIPISFPASLPVFILTDPIPGSSVYFQFYSPPLTGKQLVHYLHQIKIPAHRLIA